MKGQSENKTRENTKGREEPRHPREKRAATARGSYHGQDVATVATTTSRGGFTIFRTLRFGACFGLWVLPMLGHFVTLLLSSLIL